MNASDSVTRHCDGMSISNTVRISNFSPRTSIYGIIDISRNKGEPGRVLRFFTFLVQFLIFYFFILVTKIGIILPALAHPTLASRKSRRYI